MNQHPDSHGRPSPVKMSPFSSRVAGVSPPSSGRGRFEREMERPRTESYGELWRRANNRLSRF